MKENILFVCIENSNRSQMAQAFAIVHGAEKANAFSAGSRPSGIINPKAVTAMKELGYDLASHQSKSIDDLPAIEFDYVVTMGCGDECPYIKAKHRIDWNIPDPRDMTEPDFRTVRDLIELKVKSLLQEI